MFRAVAAFACLALWNCGRAAAPFHWQAASPCPAARFEAMGTTAGGKVLVMGGFSSAQLDVTSRIDVYDPRSDSWVEALPLPGAQTHVAVSTFGADVVLAGGFYGRLDHTTAEVWIRTTADGSFHAAPPLPHPRAAAAAATIDGLVHVVGGLAADGSSDSSEHAAGDLIGDFRLLPPLPNPRNHLGGAAIGSTLFVVGGRHSWDELAGDQGDLGLFDTGSQQWHAGAPLPQPASEIAGATFAAHARLLVVGGSIAGAEPTAKVWSYQAGSWTALPDLPEPRKGAAAVAVGNEIIVATGSPTGVDPSATTWRGCCLQ